MAAIAEESTAILLVGCGKMGGALLRGWVENAHRGSDITVIYRRPELPDFLRRYQTRGVAVYDRVEAIPKGYQPSFVVFAVKPQMLPECLPAYRHFVRNDTVFLSVAAGVSLDAFRAYLGETARLIRTIPNMPSLVGKGITAIYADHQTETRQREEAIRLLTALGEVIAVTEEAHIDAATAIAGSGPAYYYYLTECLAAAGRELGLGDEHAARFARATAIGSGALMASSADSLEILRQAITSPQGTTAAALDILTANQGLEPLMRRAVYAAFRRARALRGPKSP